MTLSSSSDIRAKWGPQIFLYFCAYGHKNIWLKITYDSVHHLAASVMVVRVCACSTVTKLSILAKPFRVMHATLFMFSTAHECEQKKEKLKSHLVLFFSLFKH